MSRLGPARTLRIVGGPGVHDIRVYGPDGKEIEGMSRIDVVIDANGRGTVEAVLTFPVAQVSLSAEEASPPGEIDASDETCNHEAWEECGGGARRCADCQEYLPPLDAAALAGGGR